MNYTVGEQVKYFKLDGGHAHGQRKIVTATVVALPKKKFTENPRIKIKFVLDGKTVERSVGLDNLDKIK